MGAPFELSDFPEEVKWRRKIGCVLRSENEEQGSCHVKSLFFVFARCALRWIGRGQQKWYHLVSDSGKKSGTLRKDPKCLIEVKLKPRTTDAKFYRSSALVRRRPRWIGNLTVLFKYSAMPDALCAWDKLQNNINRLTFSLKLVSSIKKEFTHRIHIARACTCRIVGLNKQD